MKTETNALQASLDAASERMICELFSQLSYERQLALLRTLGSIQDLEACGIEEAERSAAGEGEE